MYKFSIYTNFKYIQIFNMYKFSIYTNFQGSKLCTRGCINLQYFMIHACLQAYIFMHVCMHAYIHTLCNRLICACMYVQVYICSAISDSCTWLHASINLSLAYWAHQRAKFKLRLRLRFPHMASCID